jgi:type I restriction enzyme M protein
VIGLPANLFFGTTIPAAILLFNKGKIHGDVLFIDASREFEQSTNQNRLRDEDVEKIVATFRSRKAIEKYSHLATFAEIEENDFHLHIPRYVHTFAPEPEVDIVALQKDILRIEAELTETRAMMTGYLKELGFNVPAGTK